MTRTSELRVEIDERIRQNADLNLVVLKATEYFESEYHDLPSDPLWGDARLKWLPTPGRDGYLRLEFGEEHRENGGYAGNVDMPATQLRDEVSRNTWMRRLLSRVVIKSRSKVASARIDRFIVELGNLDG